MLIVNYIHKKSSNAVATMFSTNPGTYSWVGTYSWPSERRAPSNNDNNDSECFLVAGGGAKGETDHKRAKFTSGMTALISKCTSLSSLGLHDKS